MVQVSYPGVYVQEVPSGTRTITGVSTSIAAFIGMAKRGAMFTPTRVLSFADYGRSFSEDTSQGELTDQVRQFFLNGGQQAYIVRIAQNADASSVVLLNAAASAALTVTAKSAGVDGDQIRVEVDYDTASPERTFNLSLFRETFDASGNPVVTAKETHRNLSMDPTSAAFVDTVVNQASALVQVTAATAAAGTGLSQSARLAGTFSTAVDDAITAAGGTEGKFRIKVGASPLVTVSILAGQTSNTQIASAINARLEGVTVAVTFETFGASTRLQIASTGNDVTVTSASDSDIAATLGLGVENGGIEVGIRASARPRPSGFVSSLSALAAFADATRTTALTLKLNGPLAFDTSVTLDPNTLSIKEGPSFTGLLNVRAALQQIADAINLETDDWQAEVHGYRLALLPQGASTAGLGNTWDGTTTTVLSDLFSVTAQRAAAGLTGGSDGSAPTADDYETAFENIDRAVDLFNLMVLPKSSDDAGDARLNDGIWGAASAFCEQRRAFLIVDPPAAATSNDAALAQVNAVRQGLVKDHAALYFPRLQLTAASSIDPSGSIAGLMARIDGNRGVWKAPAGLEADLRGVRGVTVPMSDAQNGLLNPAAINAIRTFPNGIISWGARTVDGFDNSGNDDFKYVPVRRLTLFLEESLIRGLKFAVFEPNGEQLWGIIRLAAGAFMNNLFRQGAFAGKTARDAYFVKVDSETTTQNDINLGIVNVVIGFAPLKPAEFIVVTIQQKAGQVQV